MKKKQKLTVLSGAGISAESGLGTFRGSGGLWEGYDVMEVASIDGWRSNEQLVLEFYNARRKKMKEAQPNEAHFFLSSLEEKYDVEVVTQNIDNLHEVAGNTKVLHLHGEIIKACSSINKTGVVDIGFEDIEIGQLAHDGSQLRPYIVWFGESVPLMYEAIKRIEQADHLVIIGTSLEVYPAASLVNFVTADCRIYVVDPQDLAPKIQISNEVIHIQEEATTAVKMLKEWL